MNDYLLRNALVALTLSNLQLHAENLAWVQDNGDSENARARLKASIALLQAENDKPLHPVGVSVLITRVNPEGLIEVLLGRRKNNSGAGLLSTPGGRIERGETRFQAAMRELYEETGASIFFTQLEELGVRERFAFDDHYFMFYFHVRSWIGADSKPNGSFENRIPTKSEDWKFYALDSLKLEETTEPGDILEKLRVKTLVDPMGSYGQGK